VVYCGVVVAVVVVGGGVCNGSQMRTSKCTCVIFGVSNLYVLTLARNAQKEFLIEDIVGNKMNILFESKQTP